MQAVLNGRASSRQSPQTRPESATQPLVPPAVLGKLASGLFFLGGTIGTVVNFVLGLPNGPLPALLAPTAAVAGAIGWFVPWQRFPRGATFWPVPLALGFIGAAALTDLDSYAYGAFFTLVFAWIGLTQGRWSSLVAMVPAGGIYVLPLIAQGVPRDEILSVFLVIPIGAVVGESLAWVITRLRSAESAVRDALKVRNDFLDMTSHELRTPLTSIVGFSALLITRWDDLEDAQKISFIERIERNGWGLNRMVENLVTISALASSAESRPRVFNLRDLLEQTVGEFREDASGVEIRGGHGLTLMADTEQLRIILSNFISNALSHGAPPVAVSAREAGKWVEVVVTDAGEGVSTDFLPRLFEKFSQPTSGNTRTSRGLGLGLCIAKQLAQTQGGDVWYEENRPTGARFGVRLPLKAGYDDGEAIPEFAESPRI